MDLTGIVPVRRARRAMPTCLIAVKVQHRPSVARKMVDLTWADSNQIALWLRRIEQLRVAGKPA